MIPWGVEFQEAGQALNMAAIETYHRVINIMRFLLILALGSVLAGLVGFSLFSHSPRLSLEKRSAYQLEDFKNTLHEATYHSTTPQEASYWISAQKAQNVTPGKVNLVKVRGSLQQKEGKEMAVTSDLGGYQSETDTLTLRKNVTFTTSDGAVFQAPEATLRFGDKRIEGERGVTGQSPMGSLEAEQFAIQNQGRKIILKGKSTLVIQSEPGR